MQYVVIGLAVYVIWMTLIDTVILSPITKRFESYRLVFQLAFLAHDLPQMAICLRGIRETFNEQRIVMLITLNPILLYRWLRGQFPPLLPSPEEEMWISR